MTDLLRWRKEAAEIGRGWTAGRVPCGGGDDDDGPAFGWLKGSFGVFEGNGETSIGWLKLSSLTHLKTGMRVALFHSPQSAAIAGELAERVGDWSELDSRGMAKKPAWQQRAREMYRLWRAAGIMCGPIRTNKGAWIWCAPEPLEKIQ